MILTTTAFIDGYEIQAYLGLVFGDAIAGVNVVRDTFASIRDIVGGRSRSYEKELKAARDAALSGLLKRAQAIGADAVIGIDVDYETLGRNGRMLMVAATGTAVKLRPGQGGGTPGPGSPWGVPRG